MKIVVLDGATLNPGDLSWDALLALGACKVYDRTEPDEVVPRGQGADALLTNKVPLAREHIEALRRLRYIGVLATGYNVVDVAAAQERGITVTNVPTYGTAAVAQMTLALLLELTNRVGHHARAVREGRWGRSPDFCFWDFPQLELAGLTLGILGYGRIGQAVGAVGNALGMEVLAHSLDWPAAVHSYVRMVSLEQLFRESDVLTLHCPLTPETAGVVSRHRLTWMKPSAVLLNTARGGLVDEEALRDALEGGRLAGAGLDVLSVEPPPDDHPLLGAKNCIVTPHIAWATRSARARLVETAVENLAAFLRGAPRNVVTV